MARAASDRLASILPAAESRTGYLLRLSRPRFWFYLAGPVLVGLAYAADSLPALLSPVAVALFAYFLLPANVFLYGVNDAFDRDVDAHNPKKDDGGEGTDGRREASEGERAGDGEEASEEEGAGEAEAGAREVRFRRDPLVAGLVVAAGLLALAFVPALPPVGLAALAAWLFLSVEYSAPPLRFKTTPLLDSLSNGLYVLPGVVAYAAVAGAAPPLLAVAGGWCWTMAMHTFSAVPDIEPDRAAGIRTTATVLGERRSYAYCGVCWLAAAVLFGLLHPALGALLGLYPLLVVAIATASVAVERAYWWFPAINGLVGALLTLGGLWVTVHG